VRPPTPTHSRYYPRSPERLDEGVVKWVSMAEALGWGEHPERPDVIRMTKQANSAVRSVDQPAPTIAFGHDANSARWFHGDDWQGHVPEVVTPDSVRVTVEEAATLQSFPPMPWQGAKGKKFLQVGNAVPPLLAMHALKATLGHADTPPPCEARPFSARSA
jgi:DNA (cytosine-5)-methyltransferase 1